MEAQEFILVIQTTGQPLAPSANRNKGRWPEVVAQKPLGDNFFSRTCAHWIYLFIFFWAHVQLDPTTTTDMARTKRAKVVSLTKTKAKTRENKENFVENVREAANQYAYIWIFAVSNMRNAYLGEVRRLWTGSKIFFGKLRVIAKALGETTEEEIRPGLGQVSQRLRGNVGLLMTDSPPAEVLDWCNDYRRIEFARMGNRATETIILPPGPIYCRSNPPETLPHNLEPQLRALGMPTQLKRGEPTLLEEFTVCRKGEKLSAEKAQILKHLFVQMAHFRLIPLAYWSAVGVPGQHDEGAVVDVPVSNEDRELIESSRSTTTMSDKPRKSRGLRNEANGMEDVQVDDDDEDDDEDMHDEMDDIEERDKAMMLPEGMKL